MRLDNEILKVFYFFYDLSWKTFLNISAIITSLLGASVCLLLDGYSNSRYGVFSLLLILCITSWFVTFSKYRREKKKVKRKKDSVEEFEKTGIFDEPVEVVFCPEIIKGTDEDYDEEFIPFYVLYELNNFSKKVRFYAVLRDGQMQVICEFEGSDRLMCFKFEDHKLFYEYFKVVFTDNKVRKVHMKEKK